MKNINTLLICFLLFATSNIIAQVSETINVPLSNPNAKGFLKLQTHNGHINIIAYDGTEVQVEVDSYESKEKRKSSKLKGLNRIPKQNIDVSITEENNEVYIKGPNSRTDFTVRVPRNFSLNLSSHHNGEITVDGTNGAIEVNSHHGGIQLKNVSGSVVADTHHGEIEVSFTEVSLNSPMAFSTYHGDVDISFPASVKGNLKMKSSKGEIYTDFDFVPTKAKVQSESNGNRKEIKLGGWTLGQIGTGGEEFMFKTYHGDVIIRKN